MGWGVWLSILVIAISAGFAIAGKFQKSRFTHYAFKPLTMILIISLAWERTAVSPSAYAYLVVAGLCFGLAGDVFLMLPGNRIKPGLLAFLVGHVLYAIAFAQGTQVFSVPGLIIVLAYGSVFYLFLFKGLNRMRWPVLIYVITITMMGWLAFSRYLSLDDRASLLALVGAALFIFSDSTNAIKRFRKPFRAAELIVLAPYFAAQLLLALSIGG
jgi:uncharacterized membrane protein YhhN